MKRWLKRIAAGLLLAVGALQFVPVDSINPPEHGQLPASAEVQAVLRRSCYDCHSNETRWPWYAKIFPASLLIARDVKKGRGEVNFSMWEKYDERRKMRKLREIAKELKKGSMPPAYYLPLHLEARLSAAERDLIMRWAKQL